MAFEELRHGEEDRKKKHIGHAERVADALLAVNEVARSHVQEATDGPAHDECGNSITTTSKSQHSRDPGEVEANARLHDEVCHVAEVDKRNKGRSQGNSGSSPGMGIGSLRD